MNSPRASTLILVVCSHFATASVAFAAPGGVAGVAGANNPGPFAPAAVTAGNSGVVQSAVGYSTGGGARAASSASVSNGGASRGAVVAAAPARAAAPVAFSQTAQSVRSRVQPQAPVTSVGTNRQAAASRQITASPDRRVVSGGIAPNNRYIIRAGTAPTNLPNRYGSNGQQILTQADLARVAADRRATGRPASQLGITTAERNNADFARRIDRRRFRPGFYYGSYFPTVVSTYNSSYYNYPYLGGFSYGYPYTVLSTNSYPGNYAPSANYYSPEYITPDETAPAEQPAESSAQADATDSSRAAAESDSLVKDVQAELSRRGYFAGKVDGIVSAEFQTALRRFQTDMRLSPTGLINQASLYALGLN